MRPTLSLALALVLAGCASPGAAPAQDGEPAVHATDCRVAIDGETCERPTTGTPIALETVPAGNRSRVGLRVENGGEAALRFDASPPPAWFYAKDAAGEWRKTAYVKGGNGTLDLGPGGNATLLFHYGVPENGTRGKDIRYEPPFEAFPWPSGTYRVCLSAHLAEDGGWSEGWVRGCKDFRIR